MCFRGQSLSEDDQIAFGKHWGPLEVFPFAVAEGSDGQGKADPKIHRFHVNRNGPPPTAPNLGAGGSPEERTEEEQMATLQRMGGKTVASGWHSDVTWRKTPSLGSMLYSHHPNPPFQGSVFAQSTLTQAWWGAPRYCDVAPPFGGATAFSDCYAAWQGLADDEQAALRGRFCMHDFGKAALMPRVLAPQSTNCRAKDPSKCGESA